MATPILPKSHKLHKRADCEYIYVSWSPCAIRFNEELQLVDLGDAMTAICDDTRSEALLSLGHHDEHDKLWVKLKAWSDEADKLLAQHIAT